MVSKDVLLTKRDIAERWDVPFQTVYNRSVRHKDFPEPVKEYNGRNKLYSVADLEAYEHKRNITVKVR